VGENSSYPEPHERLAGEVQARFGRPNYLPPVNWVAWEEEEVWRVSAAWVQHLVAQEIRLVIAGRKSVACDFTLSDSKDERYLAVASYCQVSKDRLDRLLGGWAPIQLRELLAWLALTGITAFPVTINQLLPPKAVTEDPTDGRDLRKCIGLTGDGDMDVD
jgi:hypothetical protein